MRVYLGGCKGNWRSKFRKRFPKWKCYDPFKESRQSCLAAFTLDDLRAIERSDFVFFFINYKTFTGSCIEAGYAFASNKPIVLVFLLKGRVPPMFAAISLRVFTEFKDALDWVEGRFYK